MANATTPLKQVCKNLFVKLEHLNPTGSHKHRAAKYIIKKAILEGNLTPFGSRRILEKTGGNFGLALAFEAGKEGIGVDLVVGRSFSPLKRSLCEQFGARLVGLELLEEGLQPKEVISKILEKNQNTYFFTDQFSNPENLKAHYEETGTEVVYQIQNKIQINSNIILVKGAGTGASITGISKKLRETFDKVQVILVHPSSCDVKGRKFCDHIMEGTMVGIYPPFLELDLVNEFIPVTNREAIKGQRMFAKETGIFPGLSSGANFYVAFTMAQKFPDSTFITVSYDLGEGYLLRNLLKKEDYFRLAQYAKNCLEG